MRPLVLIVPGRLDTLTGGYGYDRRIVAGLRARGWAVTVHELEGAFPMPDASAREQAARVLAAVPDGAILLVDGLALGVLPDEVAPHAARLHLVALVHHPLAEETGIEARVAVQLARTERRALRFARCVVVTSAATAAMMGAYGVTPDRVRVVTPGTDPAPLARGSRDAALQLLCVAGLVPRKGHEVLFRALAAVPSADWRLTCVGSLEREPGTVARLRALVAAEGLESRVSFPGELEGEALAACYDAADLFVLPTLFEGYGMVVAEALARGLPVVATGTGAIPELIGDGAGIVVEPGDAAALSAALSRVIVDPALRARVAESARRMRERLPTWDQSCALMEKTLRSLPAEGASHVV